MLQEISWKIAVIPPDFDDHGAFLFFIFLVILKPFQSISLLLLENFPFQGSVSSQLSKSLFTSWYKGLQWKWQSDHYIGAAKRNVHGGHKEKIRYLPGNWISTNCWGNPFRLIRRVQNLGCRVEPNVLAWLIILNWER